LGIFIEHDYRDAVIISDAVEHLLLFLFLWAHQIAYDSGVSSGVSTIAGHTVVLLPSLIDAMYRTFHEKVVRFLTIMAYDTMAAWGTGRVCRAFVHTCLDELRILSRSF